MKEAHQKNILWAISLVLILFTLFMLQRTQSTSQALNAVPVETKLITTTLESESPQTPTEPKVTEVIEETESQLPAAEAVSASTQTSTAAQQGAPEPAPEEDEGAPEGYIGFPPRCASMIFGDDSQVPIFFMVAIDPHQTNVEIESYNYFVNDTLVQSSSEQQFFYTPSEPGSYTLYGTMDTNFGPTLKSTLCEKTFTISQEDLDA